MQWQCWHESEAKPVSWCWEMVSRNIMVATAVLQADSLPSVCFCSCHFTNTHTSHGSLPVMIVRSSILYFCWFYVVLFYLLIYLLFFPPISPFPRKGNGDFNPLVLNTVLVLSSSSLLPVSQLGLPDLTLNTTLLFLFFYFFIFF